MSVLTIFILTGDQQVTSSTRIWSHIITSATCYILHIACNMLHYVFPGRKKGFGIELECMGFHIG